ncbi:hypothetical protein WME89_00675 [Sorangium sp. So ce321]|uniref:hypothetical protein n=1 Tax=Sorangium sp. So ce321 TaxID=3133300 RepID=UPI003F5F0BF3
MQRTSGDMRLNPRLHVVFLDGAYHEDGTELRAMDRNAGGFGRTMDIVPNERSYTVTIGVVPYPTYYFAFVDLDGDGWPDPDEPLGVDPENPIDSGCDEPTRAITIKLAGAR